MTRTLLLLTMFLLAGALGQAAARDIPQPHESAASTTGDHGGAANDRAKHKGDTTPATKETGPSANHQPAGSGPSQAVPKLRQVDLHIGAGRPAHINDVIKVQYTIWRFDANAKDKRGKKLESSRERGRPFYFVLRNTRIPGWLGRSLLGMKSGGTRRLFIPAKLAQQTFGRTGNLAKGTPLVMDIKALQVFNR